MRCHSSSGAPTIGPSSMTPALLTRVSSRPSSATVVAMARCACAGSVMSASMTSACRRRRSARPAPRGGPAGGRPGRRRRPPRPARGRSPRRCRCSRRSRARRCRPVSSSWCLHGGVRTVPGRGRRTWFSGSRPRPRPPTPVLRGPGGGYPASVGSLASVVTPAARRFLSFALRRPVRCPHGASPGWRTASVRRASGSLRRRPRSPTGSTRRRSASAGSTAHAPAGSRERGPGGPGPPRRCSWCRAHPGAPRVGSSSLSDASIDEAR